MTVKYLECQQISNALVIQLAWRRTRGGTQNRSNFDINYWTGELVSFKKLPCCELLFGQRIRRWFFGHCSER